jgi:cytochrome c-type biogenesis protein CcsB
MPELATLSDQLLVGTILLYSAAMLAYAVEYSFGGRGTVARAAAPGQVLVGAGGPEVADPAGIVPVERPERSSGPAARIGWIAVALTVVGAVSHAGVLVARGLAADRVPWGNMYEFAVSVCLIAVCAWLFVVARQSRVVGGRQPVRHLGAFVMLPVVLLLGLAGTVLYTRVGPLVPALNSYWLKIHVSAAAIATGIFLVSFATGVLYLLRESYDRTTAAGRTPRFPATLGRRLPDADVLERTTFRVTAFAFPIWTFAVIAGAIWAEAAWSRYWGWDPKETWAFISWVVYAAYLHARATAGWRGRRAVWISVLGWVTMMVNLFGVNLVITGLHSYAGLQ